MRAIEFKEVNKVLAKNSAKYKSLPIFLDGRSEGVAVSCYRLSFKERLKVLFSGKIWHGQMTFHKPFQPQLMSVNKSDLILKT
jgi:hypothetical protein